MYIKVIPICWQWQQSCSSERDALFSLVLQSNEYWAYEVSATVQWLTLSQTQAGHIWGYVLCMSHRIPIRIYIYYRKRGREHQGQICKTVVQTSNKKHGWLGLRLVNVLESTSLAFSQMNDQSLPPIIIRVQ